MSSISLPINYLVNPPTLDQPIPKMSCSKKCVLVVAKLLDLPLLLPGVNTIMYLWLLCTKYLIKSLPAEFKLFLHSNLIELIVTPNKDFLLRAIPVVGNFIIIGDFYSYFKDLASK